MARDQLTPEVVCARVTRPTHTMITPLSKTTNDQIAGLMLTLAEGKTLSDLDEHGTRIVQLLGYTGFRFSFLWEGRDSIYSTTVSASASMSGAYALFDVLKHPKDDVVVDAVFTGQVPFLWPSANESGRIEGSETVTRCYDTSLVEGASFPINAQIGHIRGSLCVFDQIRSPSVRFELFERAKPQLNMLSILLFGKLLNGPLPKPQLPLSDAERQVAEMLTQGYSVAEIAATTHRSESTIRNQIASAKKHAKARTLPELIARYCHDGSAFETERDVIDLTQPAPLQMSG